jgi:hypothetical protein
MQEQENWLGFGDGCRQDVPMTMHIILPTAEGGIVWVTDTTVGLGTDNNFATLDKVLYVQPKNAACSCWGNQGLAVTIQLGKWIREGAIDLADSKAVTDLIERFCLTMMIPLFGANYSQPATQVVVVTCLDSSPRVYFGKMGLPPIAYPADNLICAGDADNPCRIFVEHYYNLSSKTTNEALFLGVHAMRKANQQKAAYIGPPNAWVCGKGVFKRLTEVELRRCIVASEALDSAILSAASAFKL